MADLETPVSAYLKIRGNGPSFLLESIEGGERLARFSFIGSDPIAVLTLRGGTATVTVDRGVATASYRDPLVPLADMLAPYQAPVLPQLPLPRFSGGAVGYLSYEAVRAFEPRVPAAPGDGLDLPDGMAEGNLRRWHRNAVRRSLEVGYDVIYVYDDEGAGRLTGGAKPVSFHEYFSFVAKRLYALVGDVTDEGFVFRVDLALRPNGNSGPPVVSLAMLEEYFQVQGREWERFAWLKSRVVAPFSAYETKRAVALRSLVTPFVYRRYLDYGVFEGLRQLHRKIREEAQRRAAGRPERANDVKLSRGGIREIEFTVQLLQVVRGGQFPEIRTRSTLRASSSRRASTRRRTSFPR